MVQAIKNQNSPSSPLHPVREKHKIAETPILIEIEEKCLFHAILIKAVCRTKKYRIVKKFSKNIYIQRYKKNETVYTKTPTEIIVLLFIFKMRHKTRKSIKKFLRSCNAKMARSANIKRSGTRLEVSSYQLAERGGVGKEG